MLERNIEIGTDLFLLGDGINQSIRDVMRIAVEEANPPQVGNSSESPEQCRQSIRHAKVNAIVRRVLADQDNLLHSSGSQLFGFAH